jgi:hypothetical protein
MNFTHIIYILNIFLTSLLKHFSVFGYWIYRTSNEEKNKYRNDSKHQAFKGKTRLKENASLFVII